MKIFAKIDVKTKIDAKILAKTKIDTKIFAKMIIFGEKQFW
jgi:hypothetical protein